MLKKNDMSFKYFFKSQTPFLIFAQIASKPVCFVFVFYVIFLFFNWQVDCVILRQPLHNLFVNPDFTRIRVRSFKFDLLTGFNKTSKNSRNFNIFYN